MGFIEQFCDQCIHEKWIHTQNDADKKCDILSRSLIFGSDDPDYPKEWIYGEGGRPVCTSFVRWDWGNDDTNGGPMKDPPPDDPNQLVMPFILDEILGQTETYELVGVREFPIV